MSPAKLAALYAEHNHVVARQLRGRIRDPEQLADALQEAWTTLAARPDDYLDERRNPRAWLYVVALHEAIGEARSNARTLHWSADSRREDGSGYDLDLIAELPGGQDPHDVVCAREVYQAVINAIAELTPGRRLATIASMLGVDYDEIGRAGGHPGRAPRGTTNTWANRNVTDGRKAVLAAVEQRLGSDYR